MFIVTEPEFLELTNPPYVSQSDLVEIFGKVPATLTPPVVDCELLDKLVARANE